MPSAKRRTLMRLVIEYLLITLPIVIYVSLEAVHRQDAGPLLHSPEWSIATIFLTFQTLRLFIEGMHKSRSELMAVLLLIVFVVLIAAATVNIHMGFVAGLESQSWRLLGTRWFLLLAATIFFVCFAGAAIWVEEQDGQHGGEAP